MYCKFLNYENLTAFCTGDKLFISDDTNKSDNMMQVLHMKCKS